MNNWFANIGVSRKLTLGFATVLILTIVLAWNGWAAWTASSSAAD